MRWVALFITLVLVTGVAYGAEKKASRQEIIKKEKRLEDVKRQIREEKKGIKEIAEKESDILGEMDRINRGLTEKREELKKIESTLAQSQKNIAFANANISRLEKDRRIYSSRLNSRLKAMYKMQKGASMELLFTADTGAEMGRRHKYLSMIMDNDSNIIAGYERSIKELASERKKLGSLMTEAETAKRSVEAKRGEAEKLYRERTALLGEVKGEKDRKLKVVSELEQAAKELSDLLRSFKDDEAEEPVGAGGFASMRGRLPMPVDGQVVSFYGKVKHPKFQTVTFNNGIVIEAPIGSSVKSVYEGKVVYVGWLKGYGQVMIIDHKGGFYTLFAYLSKALKEKGTEVGKGEEVALVGDTGPQGAAGLYFEIRQKGVPRDPLSWMAEK